MKISAAFGIKPQICKIQKILIPQHWFCLSRILLTRHWTKPQKIFVLVPNSRISIRNFVTLPLISVLCRIILRSRCDTCTLYLSIWNLHSSTWWTHGIADHRRHRPSILIIAGKIITLRYHSWLKSSVFGVFSSHLGILRDRTMDYGDW